MAFSNMLVVFPFSPSLLPSLPSPREKPPPHLCFLPSQHLCPSIPSLEYYPPHFLLSIFLASLLTLVCMLKSTNSELGSPC